MARKSFEEKQEDILMFLEDNISKLVKLKVASRAKYKVYDDCYLSYLTADSIDDEFRVEMYREQLRDCYEAMRSKLQAALVANPDLMENKAVAEYAKLMK